MGGDSSARGPQTYRVRENPTEPQHDSDLDAAALIRRIGRSLTAGLEVAGFTQRELCRRSGVKQPTASRILAGSGPHEPKLSHVRALARALGMTMDQVLGEAPPPRPLLRPRDQQIVRAYYGDPVVRRVIDKFVPKPDDGANAQKVKP